MKKKKSPMLLLTAFLILSLSVFFLIYSRGRNGSTSPYDADAEAEISVDMDVKSTPETGAEDGSSSQGDLASSDETASNDNPSTDTALSLEGTLLWEDWPIPEDSLPQEDVPLTEDSPHGGNKSLSGATSPDPGSPYVPNKKTIELTDIKLPSDAPLVCIDPGHYKDSSTLEGADLYGYGEGIFTLRLARLLAAELQKYGINSYLTRDGDSITLGGYTDEALDRGHISLRGEYSKGADLFVSLHTNGNADGANGRAQNDQPLSLNKAFIIVNRAALSSDIAVDAANAIGLTLTAVNHKRGISWTDIFYSVDKSGIGMWETGYNDAEFMYGSVYQRPGQKGDYYGVLRGSNIVGVPGMIIEHGYHTIPEVRRQAMMEDLAEDWAKADAYGIAVGFGLPAKRYDEGKGITEGSSNDMSVTNSHDEGFYISEISDELLERIKGKSYKKDCPLPLSELRYVHVLHRDFNGRTREGELVCHSYIARDLIEIFRELYDRYYPIEKIELVDEYDADDELSMRADNSSCFNYRTISHTNRISKHGLGVAVDINPLYNPYIKTVNGEEIVAPSNAGPYVDRSRDFPYKIDEDDLAYKLFTQKGFTWGGHFKNSKDYQHFELPDDICNREIKMPQ